MAWWSALSAYDRPNVILLQADLSGHSYWVEHLPTDLEGAEARADFAARLQEALRANRFDRLNWLGDGGLFVRRCDSFQDAEAVAEAASKAFRVFKEWRRPEWPLHLRVSATFAASVLVDPSESGNWCSARLNAFLKFERDIAIRGTFVITDDLRRWFRTDAACYEYFTHSRRITLGGSEQITVWIDNRFPLEVKPDPVRFLAWLHSRIDTTPFVRWRTPARADRAHSLWFADTCIFSAALESSGYQALELTLTDSPDSEPVVRSEDLADWTSLREEYRANQVTGTKLSIVRFRGELSDDPIVRLQYRLSGYEDIKAFERMLEGNVGRQEHYLPNLLRVLQSGTSVPTTLSNHVVVVVGKPSTGRHLLIAHRRKGQRPGGFYDNCWSVSFEEQFNPIRRHHGGRAIEPDRTIQECVLRGLREEFVGDRYTGTALVSVHAFAVERSILNFAALSVLELPEATIEELQSWWSAPGVAVDAEEHDDVAGIPLEPEHLRQCLASETLPEHLQRANSRVAGLADSDHRWHPTSPLRLALALWFAERRPALSTQEKP